MTLECGLYVATRNQTLKGFVEATWNPDMLECFRIPRTSTLEYLHNFWDNTYKLLDH